MRSVAATAEAPATGTVAGRQRARRRSEHQELSRTQLLDAAEEVFGRKGFHDTTLKEIAEQAGFSVGSVYSFFESKEDLFVSVFLRRGDEFMPVLEAIVATEGDPLARLHELVELEVGFFRANPHFGRLYLRTASGLSPSANEETDLASRLAPNFTRAMELQATLIRRGQRAKVFRSGDAAVLSRMFSGLVSAYQSLDPAVVDGARGERLPLAELHAIVERTFTRP